MEEICRSNIIQRDNVKFARKLNKDLVPIAKEKNKTVSMMRKKALNYFKSCCRYNIPLSCFVS